MLGASVGKKSGRRAEATFVYFVNDNGLAVS